MIFTRLTGARGPSEFTWNPQSTDFQATFLSRPPGVQVIKREGIKENIEATLI